MGLSRESSLPLSCLDDGNWSDIFDWRKATIAFNDLAIKLDLKPLPLSNSKRQGGGDCSHAHPTSGKLNVFSLGTFKEGLLTKMFVLNISLAAVRLCDGTASTAG